MKQDMICNQQDMPVGDLRYGLRRSADTGCGWIATFNALRILGKRVEKNALIHYYERQLPLIHGNTGTSFWGPAVFFKQHGFSVKMEFRQSRFDALAEQARVCVLFYRWRRGIRMGAHFVALHKTDRGFVGYNTYKNSDGPDLYGPSLEGFLKQRGYFGAVLMGIN